jgi:hypothetical protein
MAEGEAGGRGARLHAALVGARPPVQGLVVDVDVDVDVDVGSDDVVVVVPGG